jgi:hypothetical protein
MTWRSSGDSIDEIYHGFSTYFETLSSRISRGRGRRIERGHETRSVIEILYYVWSESKVLLLGMR